MTKNFDPPLESHEGIIGPNNGNQTVQEKYCEPLIVANNFCKTDLPLIKNINARYNYEKEKPSIQRTSFFHRNSAAYRDAKDVEPLR
jgi:hypothetical protein